MQRVAVQGSPAARGRQYGQLAAGRIHRAVEAYRDVFQQRAGLDWADALAHARTFVEPIGDFASDSLQEMHGIAEGAAVPFDAILMLNCRSELMFAAAQRRGESPPSECTSFAAGPGATGDGHMLLGQNWDWVPFARDLAVLLEVGRDDKPSFATIVEAGMLAKVGMNDAGVGLCTNTLVSERDANRPGVPYHVMLRSLLDATSIDDATAILGAVERALSANYLVADRLGRAVNFETIAGGATEIHATTPRDGLIAHANHFCAPSFRPIDAFVRNSPHSVTRLEDMWHELRERTPLTVGRLQAVLRSHRHEPNGVCSHPDPAAHPLYARTTVASFIADLNRGEFWFTDGPPCASEYERHAFVTRHRAAEQAR
jgi:isopenicillin-N N-acyltransferase-like protein